jgi:ABC-2 type transport system permease protein
MTTTPTTTATTTATAMTGATDAVRPAASRPPGTVTMARVVHAELVKLRTVRSTVVTLAATAVSLVGMGAFAAVGTVVSDAPPVEVGADPTADPTAGSLSGVGLAVLIVAALGVLAVTGEYGSGTIRATLTAVPGRGRLAAGKTVALAVAALAVTLASTLASFFTARAIVATDGLDVSLGQPGVARAVVGAALYLTLVAVFASGLAWLLRSAAGALAAVFGILYVLPAVGLLLPAPVADAVLPYLPDNAGHAIMQLSDGGQLGPWTGLAVFAGYAAATLAAAVAVLRRRDA